MITNYINYVDYFISIEIIDIIAIIDLRTLPFSLHVALCLQHHGFHYIWWDQSKATNKKHPASVPGTLQAVAGRLRKTNSQAARVQNGSGVTERNNWQFSQDTFNGDDLENWFLVVELV